MERSRYIALAGALAGLSAVSAAPVSAHEDGVPFRDWLVSRQRPDRPGPCCGAGPGTDQYYATRYEPDPSLEGGYLVWVEGFDGPAQVPPDKVILDDVNPTGRGVIWMSTNWAGSRVPGVVFCFETGSGF